MGSVRVDDASLEDLPEIADVYHHYVLATAHTFDLEERPSKWWGQWFSRFADGGRHRLLVARGGTGILGYTSSDRYRDRPAYDPSVLTSVYIIPDHVGKGIGTALYSALFEALEGSDVHRA